MGREGRAEGGRRLLLYGLRRCHRLRRPTKRNETRGLSYLLRSKPVAADFLWVRRWSCNIDGNDDPTWCVQLLARLHRLTRPLLLPLS